MPAQGPENWQEGARANEETQTKLTRSAATCQWVGADVGPPQSLKSMGPTLTDKVASQRVLCWDTYSKLGSIYGEPTDTKLLP